MGTLRINVHEIFVCIGNIEDEISLSRPHLASRTGFSSIFSIPKSEDYVEFVADSLSHVSKSFLPDISALVFVSSASTYSCPGDGQMIASRLGWEDSIPIFNISDACTGFMSGMVLSSSLATALGGLVVLVTADAYSRHIDDSRDSSVAGLFSDAVSIAVLSDPALPNRHEVKERWCWDEVFVLNDPTFADALSINFKDQSVLRLDMRGAAVYSWVIDATRGLVEELESREIAPSSFDDVLIHQGSLKVADAISHALNWDGKPLFRAEKYGNLVGASLPKLLLDDFPVALNRSTLVVAFGMGMSYRAAIVSRLPSVARV